MYEVDDITCGKLERVSKLLDAICQLTESTPAGDWHAESTDEYKQFASIAQDFRRSRVSEVATFGYRMAAYLREMTEFDRTMRREEKWHTRAVRKQSGLYARSAEKMEAAFKRIPLTKEAR